MEKRKEYSVVVILFDFHFKKNSDYFAKLLNKNSHTYKIKFFKTSNKVGLIEDIRESISTAIDDTITIFCQIEKTDFKLRINKNKIIIYPLGPIKTKIGIGCNHSAIDWAFYIELMLQLIKGLTIAELYTQEID